MKQCAGVATIIRMLDLGALVKDLKNLFLYFDFYVGISSIFQSGNVVLQPVGHRQDEEYIQRQGYLISLT